MHQDYCCHCHYYTNDGATLFYYVMTEGGIGTYNSYVLPKVIMKCIGIKCPYYSKGYGCTASDYERSQGCEKMTDTDIISDIDITINTNVKRSLTQQFRDTVELYSMVFGLPDNPFDKIIQLAKIGKVVHNSYVKANTIRNQ